MKILLLRETRLVLWPWICFLGCSAFPPAQQASREIGDLIIEWVGELVRLFWNNSKQHHITSWRQADAEAGLPEQTIRLGIFLKLLPNCFPYTSWANGFEMDEEGGIMMIRIHHPTKDKQNNGSIDEEKTRIAFQDLDFFRICNLFFLFLVCNCTRVRMCKIMWKCENAQMWNCANLRMCNCENVQMWKCANVKMWKCANVQMC